MTATVEQKDHGYLAHGITFGEAVRVWARVASLSFGGPAGQIAVMHRILVEEKRWISETRFLHALNYCMLLPGPEAQQLAIYIGWLLHRIRGGVVAGGLFVLPGFVALMILSWFYAAFGAVPAIQALFLGLKAAVLAVVLEAVLRIGRRALKTNAARVVAASAFIGIFVLGLPFPAIIITAAIVGVVGHRTKLFGFGAPTGHGPGGADEKDTDTGAFDRAFADGLPTHVQPSARRAVTLTAIILTLWLGPLLALFIITGPEGIFTQIAAFFARMAVVTFGGAYAVLAYVAQQAVSTYGWLRPGEMLDGLGMAETTPGPLIIVLQFVGFMGAFRNAGAIDPMVAGTLGGILATWTTFTPCFLWIFLGGPYVESLRANAWLNAALSAITAAIVGVILNLALWFALHVIFGHVDEIHTHGLTLQVPALSSLRVVPTILTAAAMAALFIFRAGMIWTFVICAAAGIAFYAAGYAG